MAGRKRLTIDEVVAKMAKEIKKGLPNVDKETYTKALEYAGNLYDEKKIDKETGVKTNARKYSANTAIQKAIKKYTPASTMSTAEKLLEYAKTLK